jgi:hypothetical protein
MVLLIYCESWRLRQDSNLRPTVAKFANCAFPRVIDSLVSDAWCFPAVTVETPVWSIGACGLKRGDQVLIAAISGPTPRIVIIRFRL